MTSQQLYVDKKIAEIDKVLEELAYSKSLIILSINGDYKTQSLNLTSGMGVNTGTVKNYIMNLLTEKRELLKTIK